MFYAPAPLVSAVKYDHVYPQLVH